MEEIWKEVPNFSGYEVSNLGQVRSFKRIKTRILNPSNDGHYRSLWLMCNGKKYRRLIGHLVLLAFVGPPPDDMEMCHNDGDSFNDKLDNLRYDTHAANMQDASRHGRMIGKGKPKLDQKEVCTIRIKFASGKYPRSGLAKEFGVSTSTITHVLIGQGAYEGGSGPIQRPCKRLKSYHAEAIRKERASGESLASLAEKYGISASAISRIASGKRHDKAAGPRIQPYEIICRS